MSDTDKVAEDDVPDDEESQPASGDGDRDRGSSGGGSAMGLDPNEDLDEDTVQEIEEERQERLDPENYGDDADTDEENAS